MPIQERMARDERENATRVSAAEAKAAHAANQAAQAAAQAAAVKGAVSALQSEVKSSDKAGAKKLSALESEIAALRSQLAQKGNAPGSREPSPQRQPAAAAAAAPAEPTQAGGFQGVAQGGFMPRLLGSGLQQGPFAGQTGLGFVPNFGPGLSFTPDFGLQPRGGMPKAGVAQWPGDAPVNQSQRLAKQKPPEKFTERFVHISPPPSWPVWPPAGFTSAATSAPMPSSLQAMIGTVQHSLPGGAHGLEGVSGGAALPASAPLAAARKVPLKDSAGFATVGSSPAWRSAAAGAPSEQESLGKGAGQQQPASAAMAASREQGAPQQTVRVEQAAAFQLELLFDESRIEVFAVYCVICAFDAEK